MKKDSFLFSGVRPTGSIHIGNYLGAIKNWVYLQEKMKGNLFCIVDLHALTTIDDCKKITDNIYLIAATYIACGINVSKSTIFVQSHVEYHLKLAWILSCITPISQLNNMIQFKEKIKNSESLIPSCGLFFYPILMASDILLYNATHVAVGDDQKQHLELVRHIGQIFNFKFKKNHFNIPEPLIYKIGSRIMSLRNGINKMSKTDISDYTRINLTDTKDQIHMKIKKAKTDQNPLPYSIEELEIRPEAKNLINIFSSLLDKNVEEICNIYGGKSFFEFKKDLIELLIDKISPIGKKINELLMEKKYLLNIIQDGSEKAKLLAEGNMKIIQDLVNS